MSLVRLDDVSLAYGEQKLLTHVGFEIDPGERVCLIGRNGTGKTSLFRLITGIVQPDSGLIQYRNGLVMSTLDQAAAGECRSHGAGSGRRRPGRNQGAG